MTRASKRTPQHATFIACCGFLLLAACSPRATPTLFIPPVGATTAPTQAISVVFATSTPASEQLDVTLAPDSTEPALDLPSPTPAGCTDSLKFLEDVTIPDGTVVTAGQTMDKQWRVQNDGSCDWGDGYKLKLVSGDPLGAPAEVALYPARAGAETVIQMTLTAPQTAGTYHTAWQAYNPDGTPFEQAIYVEIVVQ